MIELVVKYSNITSCTLVTRAIYGNVEGIIFGLIIGLICGSMISYINLKMIALRSKIYHILIYLLAIIIGQWSGLGINYIISNQTFYFMILWILTMIFIFLSICKIFIYCNTKKRMEDEHKRNYYAVNNFSYNYNYDYENDKIKNIHLNYYHIIIICAIVNMCIGSFIGCFKEIIIYHMA